MCRGDAQGLSDLRMIPASSNLRNSSLAVRSLSGSRRRALANTGRPVVWGGGCRYLFGEGQETPGATVLPGLVAVLSPLAGQPAGWQGGGGPVEDLPWLLRGGSPVECSGGCHPGWTGTAPCGREGEMSRLNFVKKSIPRIGLATSANKNRCVNLVCPNLICKVL